MDTIRERALAAHGSGSNCAQSVLCAFADELGFDERQAHRLATGLGAGLGRRQSLCGAVSGGAMALGFALGNDDGTDLDAKERCYRAVKDYVEGFESEFGSLECRTLLGVDLGTEEGRAEHKARCLSVAVCDKLIGWACELALAAMRKARGEPARGAGA